MIKIKINTIPDEQQRYDTVGDYQTQEDGLQAITVSEMGNSNFEFLVALHELIESKLCSERGITDEAIDKFDIEYENNRSTQDTVSEPGNQPEAPYYKEHLFATKIEKLMCDELGVDWEEYSKACSALTRNSK